MKRQHPIRKMSRQMWGKDNWAFMDDDEKRLSDKIAARHIKPLLDALELEHEGDMVGCRCSTCRLLAEWRAKL